MKLHWLVVLAPCLVFLVACAATPRPLNAAELAQTQAAASPNNRLAIELYRRFGAKDPAANLFFSPVSIAEAFAMLQTGARGPTGAQLERFLAGGGDAPADLVAAYGAWGREINGQHATYALRMANAVWVANDRPLQGDFVGRLKREFDAPPEVVDFKADPAGVARRVNAWVAKHTEDKITDVLSPRSIDPSTTKLILANAIYFKGTWEHTFNKDVTRPDTFHAPGGTDVQVPMMRLSHEGFPYAEDDELQALEMPYKGGELSMLVLLPRKADGLAPLEKALSVEKVDGIVKRLERRSPIVEFPKFTVRSDIDLAPPLKEMGLADVFKPGVPDFSGMDGTRDLYVQAALHAAFVNVDEQGTEAAAATVIRMGATAAPVKPLTFRADHPFLFVIRQARTGGYLFVGRVTNPAAQ